MKIKILFYLSSLYTFFVLIHLQYKIERFGIRIKNGKYNTLKLIFESFLIKL